MLLMERKKAEALGLKGQRGVRVSEVYPGSNAETAGLRIGPLHHWRPALDEVSHRFGIMRE